MDSLAPVEQSLTALVAEDDRSLRPYVSLVLQQEGFLVLEACNGTEALRILRQNPGRIDLLITDVHMGEGPSGIEVAEQFRSEGRNLAVLVISGTLEGGDLAMAKGLPFLAKPFPLATLIERVREVVANGPSPLRGRTADESD